MEYYCKKCSVNSFDKNFLYEVRNNKGVRSNLINSGAISLLSHDKWWEEYCRTSDKLLIYIVYSKSNQSCDDTPVGYFDLKVCVEKKEIEIGFKILPEHHGHGAGVWCLLHSLSIVERCYPKHNMWLSVFKSNNVALGIYKRFGFGVTESVSCGERVLYIMRKMNLERIA